MSRNCLGGGEGGQPLRCPPSSSAKADDPVRRAVRDRSPTTLEYWMPAFAGMTSWLGQLLSVYSNRKKQTPSHHRHIASATTVSSPGLTGRPSTPRRS